MSTVEVISATARLITRVSPMEIKSFNELVEWYVNFRIERGEYSKALYYAYTALVDCLKDPANEEKQQKRDKILDYIAFCAQKMKEQS